MSRVCLVGLIAVFVGNVDLCAHDKAQKVFEQLSKDSELGSWNKVFEKCTRRAETQLAMEIVDLAAKNQSTKISDLIESSDFAELFSEQLIPFHGLKNDRGRHLRLKIVETMSEMSRVEFCKLLHKLTIALKKESLFGSKLDAMGRKVTRIEQKGDIAIGYLMPKETGLDTFVDVTSIVPIRVRFARANNVWQFDGFVEEFE